MSVKLTLPDGKIIEIEKGAPALEGAKAIGERLAKSALAVKLNGELADVSVPVEEDAEFAVITERSDEALEILRHTTAHVMAQAVKRLYPDVKLTIGPIFKRGLDEGFYYDFDFGEGKIGENELSAIEEEMTKISRANIQLVKSEKSHCRCHCRCRKRR